MVATAVWLGGDNRVSSGLVVVVVVVASVAEVVVVVVIVTVVVVLFLLVPHLRCHCWLAGDNRVCSGSGCCSRSSCSSGGDDVGSNIARLMLWFMLLSSGMFISCSAFLPSSFSMYLIMVATAGWLSGDIRVCSSCSYRL